MHDPLRIRINSISKSVKFKVPALASHLMRYSNKFKNIPTFIKERIPHKNLYLYFKYTAQKLHCPYRYCALALFIILFYFHDQPQSKI